MSSADSSSTLIEARGTGGSFIIGDECGRLTAIGWEFHGDSTNAGPGTVQIQRQDMGSVSPPK